MIAAVILAGGSGERFWPLSTSEKPKQFLDLAPGGGTLLQAAWNRAQALAEGRVWVATLPHLIQPTRNLLGRESEGRILAEPTKRDTAGALIWAAAVLRSQLGEAADETVMAVLTADQVIQPLDGFLETAHTAAELARAQEGLVTIGIQPDRPETGFGYIEAGAPVPGGFAVQRFREKPNRETAEEFLARGGFFWNSGMFFWTLGSFRKELRSAHADMADVLDQITEALLEGEERLAVSAFEALPKLSIDYALMERSDRVFMVPAGFEWDDLGSWDSVPRVRRMDGDGNTTRGPVRIMDSAGCIVESHGPRVNLLGVEDLVVVVTPEEVLVMPRHRCQDVKKLTTG